MKHYKLLRDLPTFKVGDEFYLDEEGNLMFEDEKLIIAYSKQTLEKFPNILTDWFEEIPEEYKKRRAKKGEGYWYLNDYGVPYADRDYGFIQDNHRYIIGNYAKTEEELEEYRNYLVALQIIKDDAKGFVPDWKDKNQIKYYGFYNHDDSFLNWSNASYSRIQGVIYFETVKDIKESFKKHRKEWLTVLGVENESN